MKGTQGVGELGQNLSLGPHTDQQRIDKTTSHSGASRALADKGVAMRSSDRECCVTGWCWWSAGSA